MARSFWAQLLLLASVALNVAGVDLFKVLGDMGLGSSPEEVIRTGETVAMAVQQVLPLVFGVWAWLERRAPKHRLTFKAPKAGVDLVGPGSSVLAVALAVGLAASAAPAPARADVQRCAGAADVLAGLAARYGEEVLWLGQVAGGGQVAVTVAPDGTTWTVLVLRGDGQACLLAAGLQWGTGADAALPGVPG